MRTVINENMSEIFRSQYIWFNFSKNVWILLIRKEIMKSWLNLQNYNNVISVWNLTPNWFYPSVCLWVRPPLTPQKCIHVLTLIFLCLYCLQLPDLPLRRHCLSYCLSESARCSTKTCRRVTKCLLQKSY